MKFFNHLFLIAAITATPALVSPFTYGTCQTGCHIVMVACYSAAGFTFGTVAAPAVPAAILGCNSALGTCSASCAVLQCPNQGKSCMSSLKTYSTLYLHFIGS